MFFALLQKDLFLVMFFALLQKDLFLGMQSLVEGFFTQNHSHACHTRFVVISRSRPVV